MLPPQCSACGRDLDEGGESGALEFARTDADHEWDRLGDSQAFVGHPPYAGWFCRRHHSRAQKLQRAGFTLGQARKLLRWPNWLGWLGTLGDTPEPAHECRRALDLASPDAVISGRVMGDVVTELWFRCEICGLWHRRAIRDSFTTGEHDHWTGPFSDEKCAAEREAIARCNNPRDDRCRCAAHRDYFGDHLDG